MTDAVDSDQKRAIQAAATAEAAAESAEKARERAERAANYAEQLDKRSIEAMAVYQDRLNHEYDKGWEQIRIVAYVSAGVLVGTGWLLREGTVAKPELVTRAVSLLGFVMALGSLFNQIGSQFDARDLRRTLASLEHGVPVAYYRPRTSWFGLTGAALLLIGIVMLCFWGAAFVYGPGALRGSSRNGAAATSKPAEGIPETEVIPDGK